MKPRKLLERLQHGDYANVAFDDLVALAEAFGFRLDRTRGSHRIYFHEQSSRPLNIQNVRGQAKPYQVRQFLEMVEEFDLQFKG